MSCASKGHKEGFHVRTFISIFVGLFFAVPLFAQMHAVSVEKLPLSSQQQWSQPVFSPDGRQLYYTTQDFSGIWEFTLSSKSSRQITDAPRSGFGFALSDDGKTISYRRTLDEASPLRSQELVTQDISSSATTVLERGEDVSLPIFVRSSVVYSKKGVIANATSVDVANGVHLLGIEDTKIILLKNGKKVVLDPLGNGSYIWPSLSPDGTKLLAYEMDHGAFISDLDGNVLRMLGRKDNPVWTRDGKWIVYTNDKDDGNTVLSSDIYCVSADGATVVQLTNTNDVIELYPACSPTENEIVCSSLNGDIYMISYSEEESR